MLPNLATNARGRPLKWLFFILSLSLFCLNAEEVTLTEENVKAIEPVFDHLFKFEPLSYTLFFDKPVSFSQISKINHVGVLEIGHLLSPDNSFLRIHSGWIAWKKWAAERQFKNYMFIDKSADGFLTIILINKKEFRRVFDHHKALFHKVLGSEMSAELLMEQIASEQTSLRKALHHDVRLLGILLGYGSQNAQAFYEREKFMASEGMLLAEEYRDVQINGAKRPLKGVYEQFSLLYQIQPVQFVGLQNDPETDRLIRDYSQASSSIAKKFKSYPFVRVVVQELCK